MDVPVGITPEQASLLLPLLRQISGGHGSTSSCQGHGTPPMASLLPSTSSSSSSDRHRTNRELDYGSDSSSCRHSCDELFQRKGRNGKSSTAHSYCHVCTCLLFLVARALRDQVTSANSCSNQSGHRPEHHLGKIDL